VDEFQVLTKYLADNNLDLPAILTGWVKSGTSLGVNTADYSLPAYYIIDLRAPADFNAGAIKGAVNTTLANVVIEAEKAAGKPILVVCYTGQTAARAVGMLRLLKKEAYVLKWGMAAWHDNLAGSWKSNVGDFLSPNWTNDAPKVNGNFAFPKLKTGKADGESILKERILVSLAKAEWGLKKEVILANPENWFINNKWPEAVRTEFGAVKGSYRIDSELKLDGLQLLDPSKAIITYCYTGQTSAIINAWLDVLGYDTRSMLFGANSVVHTKMLGGSQKASTWMGTGSGSVCNYGYYDSTGKYYAPK
jgi:rhodanese-related sulfurtransferase